MEIIILSGKANNGKTTTLKMLYSWLIAKGAAVSNGKILYESKKNSFLSDIECLLYYKGKNIALYTLGDYAHSINAGKNFAKNNNANVLIVACNNDRYLDPKGKACGQACLFGNKCKYSKLEASDIVNVIIKSSGTANSNPFLKEESELVANINDCKTIASRI